MQIGSRPGQQVFQDRQGGDTFLVFSPEDCMLYLYRTVDTLLCPSITAFEEEQDKPYFWAENSGMMYVLSEISQRSFEDAQTVEKAQDILEELEVYLETL